MSSIVSLIRTYLLDKKSLNMLYNAILAPHFDYYDVIWGTCNTATHHKVQIMQNRAAKIITGVTRYDSSTEGLNALTGIILKTGITSILPLPCAIL